MFRPLERIPRLTWRAGRASGGDRAVPEETAVAFTYDGGSYAVMMASPGDLEDFALGFSLTEGIVESPGEIERLDVVEEELGIELRMWLAAPKGKRLGERRRRLAGPTGCGLCGAESLADVFRPLPHLADGRVFTPGEIMRAVESVAPAQVVNRQTRTVHAAAFWEPERGLVALREDVGRHNALDKLAGALARAGTRADRGMIVLTSRVSIEMVNKAAMIGASLVAAVSAPTALAVRTAEKAGLTLVAVARDDGFEVFAHPYRVALEAAADVA
jgi:FdhD protein